MRKKATFREISDMTESFCKADVIVKFNADFTTATITERQRRRLNNLIYNPVFDNQTSQKYPDCKTLITKMKDGGMTVEKI